ncbi:hypothetical protein BCR33DRAFT_712331 [Rhizoclosmatium globosum]|uniref:Mediator of RNA polymerase II transcription subunit 10 n=1 Tax=Rhizoclosmatium globosum TaxID=329046 RepID=A0A1Y2CYM4_9FUNG|nr:hypothetical protein HDU79_008766 [Rhizoclosmatium sp. JEL0117]ORY52118.1 hypothetical protein BCR33DRAFT_712331 [Rhizoclosmatium globosum]|eukprot:ORY52118.1 hypothetical protein BCR33DRAFT_712331 [Rhizoclosmatium globosum]
MGESIADEQALAALEKSIASTIDTLLKISATTFDYQADSGPVLQRRITKLTNNLANVEAAGQAVETNVPLSAVECIESGASPDTYTKSITQVLVDKNQKTNGIITAVTNLHNQLAEEIRKNYPELHAEYERMLKEEDK